MLHYVTGGNSLNTRGYAVARFVEALRYSSIPEGVAGFVIDIIFPAALRPWVCSTSNRNEYFEYFLRDKGGRYVVVTKKTNILIQNITYS